MPDYGLPMSDEPHRFGGRWTEEKLEILTRYLKAYTTALQSKPSPERPFVKAYIDAFAGSGHILARTQRRAPASLLPEEDAARDEHAFLEGSAQRALAVEPRFDRYIFIEKKGRHRASLERVRREAGELASRIDIRGGDANEEIRGLCSRNWRSRRAVLFLDPYGMQVEWRTIEAVAATRAIDLWVLFPHGIGAGRMLTRSGEMPASWRRRLDLVFGDRDWERALYSRREQRNLFGDVTVTSERVGLEAIGRYYNQRLATVFAKVAEHPRVLVGPTGTPLYLLCFAAGNPRGAALAVKLARHLLEDRRD